MLLSRRRAAETRGRRQNEEKNAIRFVAHCLTYRRQDARESRLTQTLTLRFDSPRISLDDETIVFFGIIQTPGTRVTKGTVPSARNDPAITSRQNAQASASWIVFF